MNSKITQAKGTVMTLQTLKEKLSLDSLKSNKSLWALVVLAGLLALTFDHTANSRTKPTALETGPVVDTIIPRGFTLIPIEIQNYEALDSVFGNYGIVTLYSVPESGQGQPKKLAERVKMLRAPQNPTQFGVLIRESDSDLIAGQIGPVFVVLHNRSTTSGGVNPAQPEKVNRFKIVEDSE